MDGFNGNFWRIVAVIASAVLPLWNIPLISRVIRRRSSQDLSLPWVFGVWTCLLLMLPAGVRSVDIVWRVFCLANFLLFSGVVITVVWYRRPQT